MVGIGQGLHGIALGGVPDLHGQLAVAAGVAAAVSAGGDSEGHRRGHEEECGSFQMFHVFAPFNTLDLLEEDRVCAPSQAYLRPGPVLLIPRTAVLTGLV